MTAAVLLGAAALAGFVPVDGHRMYYACSGSGSPTVVLDAGSPNTTAEWRWVQPRLARVTRVCAYDRAGLGESAPAPKSDDRTGLTQVRELHTLLHAAHVPGPYVIAGHSWGGLLSELFAHTYPSAVAGVALFDPTAFVYGVPPLRRTNAEGIDVPATARELAQVRNLGHVPLAVLGSKTNLANARFGAALEREAALSTNSVEAIAPDSSHNLPYPPPQGRPDLVEAAVLAVVHAARTHSRIASCRAVFGRSVRC